MSAPLPSQGRRYLSFGAFYPFYVSQHANCTCRRLHVIGTGCSVILAIAALILQDWRLGLTAMLCGYAFAWVGHFFFEKNRPATFTYPLWSLMGDFRLLWETLIARRRW